MTNIKPDIWNADFHHLSQLYNPIIPAFHQLNHNNTQWPNLEEFQNLIDSHTETIINSQNKPIQFIEQATECNSFKDQYEPRIYLKGEVQTRLNNWHDFFQVLVWHTFPKAKILLNALHYQASTKRLSEKKPNRQRSTIENFLTLFDECGIVIVSHTTDFLDMIKNFQWQELFWKNRTEFDSNIECFTFGHAMYEKALSPYIGMTANAMLIHIDKDFFNLDYSKKLLAIDSLIIENIKTQDTLSPKTLNPFPILGVPSWYKNNDNLGFYLNENYFRKGRRKKKSEN